MKEETKKSLRLMGHASALGIAIVLATAIGLARAYRGAGKPDKARAVLQKALKANPASPRAAEAKKLLAELE